MNGKIDDKWHIHLHGKPDVFPGWTNDPTSPPTFRISRGEI